MNQDNLKEIMEELKINVSDISDFYGVPISLASRWVKYPVSIPFNVHMSLYSLYNISTAINRDFENLEIALSNFAWTGNGAEKMIHTRIIEYTISYEGMIIRKILIPIQNFINIKTNED